MIQRYNKIIILLLVVFAVSNAFAQQIKGVVTDSVTHEPLMYISVYYQDKRDMGTVTNIDGEYKLDARRNGGTLIFSSIGYVSKTVKVGSGNQTVNVKLSPDDVMLTEVVVKPQKEKYSRKNNPAVEFMKKVIEHVHQRPDTGETGKRYLQEILIPQRSGRSIGDYQQTDSPDLRAGDGITDHLPERP